MTSGFTNPDVTNVTGATNGTVVTNGFHTHAYSVVKPHEFGIPPAVITFVALAITWWLLRRKQGKSNRDAA